MKQLIDYLLQFGQLNEKKIALVKARAHNLHLPKNAYFSEAGKIARQLAFVQEGVLRVCYYNNKGQEITHHFTDENHFIVDLDSFKITTKTLLDKVNMIKPMLNADGKTRYLDFLENLHFSITNIGLYLIIGAFFILALNLLSTNYNRLVSNN